MSPARQGVRLQSYLGVYALLAVFLILGHGLLLSTPFYWDELGQFIPASLDLFHFGAWIARSTLPNVHPPGVMAWLALVWHVTGYSIAITRVAMLLIAALGVLATFLLAIELSRGAPGAPAFTAIALLCVSPLFYAQSMMAQLDMPAMSFTALALLLFLQNRHVYAAIVCVILVLMKETGIVAPLLFGAWVCYEERGSARARAALWYLAPLIALCLWLLVLKLGTGHWFGNSAFTQYNLFYPLNPFRMALAVLRRLYYLFAGSGHFIGTAVLIYAWRRMPLLRSRSWRIAGVFAAAHVVVVSVLGGAVLERYLLPVLPILYTAFALSLRALMPRARNLTLAAFLICLAAANFVNPVYPFPFENNLAFTHFVKLQQRAATSIQTRTGVVATAFPMSDALRRPEFGYVDLPWKVIEIHDFTRNSVLSLQGRSPAMMAVFDTTWDPLHIFGNGPFRWILAKLYNYEAPLSPGEIAQLLGMRVARRWESGGQWMVLLVRNTSGPSV